MVTAMPIQMPVDPPVVSVVVACRNESRWISDCLRSVLEQTHRNLEIIVVDDGSTDGTPEIVESIPDPRLRLVRQQPRGACAARNVGMRQARGDLIQMLDGDDMLAPDKIEHQVACWRQDGDAYVYFGPYARFIDTIAEAVQRPETNWRDMSGLEWLVSAWSDGGMMAPHSWLTPAPLIRAAGEWDESLMQNQDGEYFSRVLLASSGVRFCSQALSYYRQKSKHSISKRVDRPARESRLRSTLGIIDRLMGLDGGERTRQACGNAIEEVMFQTYPEFPDLSSIARRRLAEIGGGDGTRPFRGPYFKTVSTILGWRGARLLQHTHHTVRDRLRRA